MLRQRILYIRVYQNHFLGRVVGADRRVRRDCRALDNRRHELKDFSRIREVLQSLVKELAPGFSLRRPMALLHFIPTHYQPSQKELASFKQTAERCGISFCWLSKWATPNTARELANAFRLL